MTARRRVGFSLLEVMIALGVLALSLTVLVDAQATAVIMTQEAGHLTTATMLAREKTSEVMLILETKGFQEGEVYEEGDFSKGVMGEYAGGGMDGQYDDINKETFEGYSWAYTIREVELQMPSDLGSMADQLSGMSPTAEQTEARTSQYEDQKPDLNDLGVSNDMLSDMVSPYIREVRVTVWWGEDYDQAEENGDLVELVTHAVNPSGQMVPGASTGSTGDDSESTGSSSSGGGSGGGASGGGSGGGASGGGAVGGSAGGGGAPGKAIKKGGR